MSSWPLFCIQIGEFGNTFCGVARCTAGDQTLNVYFRSVHYSCLFEYLGLISKVYYSIGNQFQFKNQNHETRENCITHYHVQMTLMLCGEQLKYWCH